MTNVQFEEEQQMFTSRRILGGAVMPGMVKMLIKTGLVKDSSQAKYILVGVVVVCILITVFVLYSSISSKGADIPNFPTPFSEGR